MPAAALGVNAEAKPAFRLRQGYGGQSALAKAMADKSAGEARPGGLSRLVEMWVISRAYAVGYLLMPLPGLT